MDAETVVVETNLADTSYNDTPHDPDNSYNDLHTAKHIRLQTPAYKFHCKNTIRKATRCLPKNA
jgi:hypothetical protein